MTLIRELTQEHARILNSLMAMDELGIGTQEGLTALRRARQELISHMNKEEMLIYEPLRTKSASNQALRRTVQIFTQDIPSLTREVLGFFEKYEAGEADSAYADNYSAMIAQLKTRIRREETILFKEYQSTMAFTDTD